MAVASRIRVKTENLNDVKGKFETDLSNARSGTELTLPKAEAARLVDGGFADYLDQSGNVIAEEFVRSKDTEAGDQTPADGGVGRRSKANKTASEPSEGELAQPAEERSVEEAAATAPRPDASARSPAASAASRAPAPATKRKTGK